MLILLRWLHDVTVGDGFGLGAETSLDVVPLEAATRVPELDIPVLPLVVIKHVHGRHNVRVRWTPPVVQVERIMTVLWGVLVGASRTVQNRVDSSLLRELRTS